MKPTAYEIVPYLLLAVGSICLFSSPIVSSYLLTFVGLGLTFWGVFFLYVKPTKYVKLELLTSASVSALANIEKILTSAKTGSTGVYLPPRLLRDYTSSLVFVPTKPDQPLPSTGETGPMELETRNQAGLLITPPGLALSRLFERELKKPFTETSLEELRGKLPRLFDELQITKHLTVEIEGGGVTVRIWNHVFEDLCRETALLELTHRAVGCPLSSALACAFAKAAGKPVVIEGEETVSNGATTIRYRVLGEWEVANRV